MSAERFALHLHPMCGCTTALEQIVDLDSLSRAWRGLTSPRRTAAPIAQRVSLIVETACDHPTRPQNGVRMVCMKTIARASSTEAFKNVLATIVRADEVVAMDADRTLVG